MKDQGVDISMARNIHLNGGGDGHPHDNDPSRLGSSLLDGAFEYAAVSTFSFYNLKKGKSNPWYTLNKIGLMPLGYSSGNSASDGLVITKATPDRLAIEIWTIGFGFARLFVILAWMMVFLFYLSELWCQLTSIVSQVVSIPAACRPLVTVPSLTLSWAWLEWLALNAVAFFLSVVFPYFVQKTFSTPIIIVIDCSSRLACCNVTNRRTQLLRGYLSPKTRSLDALQCIDFQPPPHQFNRYTINVVLTFTFTEGTGSNSKWKVRFTLGRQQAEILWNLLSAFLQRDHLTIRGNLFDRLGKDNQQVVSAQVNPTSNEEKR